MRNLDETCQNHNEGFQPTIASDFGFNPWEISPPRIQNKGKYQPYRSPEIPLEPCEAKVATTSSSAIKAKTPQLSLSSCETDVYLAWLQLRRWQAEAFSSDEITLNQYKACYRTMVRRFHPDLNQEDTTSIFIALKEAFSAIEKAFSNIIEAYDI